MGHREEDERRAQGEIAGRTRKVRTGAPWRAWCCHRDDAGEFRRTEIYSGASRRLDPDGLDFERVPAKGASASS